MKLEKYGKLHYKTSQVLFLCYTCTNIGIIVITIIIIEFIGTTIFIWFFVQRKICVYVCIYVCVSVSGRIKSIFIVFFSSDLPFYKTNVVKKARNK